MNVTSIFKRLAQFFMYTSYLTCALQWFWLGILVLGVFAQNGMLDTLNQHEPVVAPVPTHEPASPVALAIGGIVTVAMIIITVVVLIRLPKAIAKTSQVVTERATETILPVVSHHKKLPKKKKLQLSAKLTFYIRLALIALPFLLLLALPQNESIKPQLVIFVGGLLAITTLTLLAVESVIALALPKKKR
ncbi:TPA: hypothetical protein DIV49_00490 [Candidatus Saccharibacteria bacterium]|nr:hypothetical protein [Candidatus Saccharibacteria bacterium]HRJ90923.1 hypothetical protein [Candidatus Saccharibacteria bacterium]